jgi:hypothetical protein
MDLEKRLRRLEMQNRLLASKLYQVCLSHDHLSTTLQRAGIPMTNTDKCMMEATARIVKAKTPEEIETIYSESSSKIFKGNFTSEAPAKPTKTVSEVFFFPFAGKDDLISKIEKMISDIDEQIKGMSREDQELYEKGMADDVDDKDLPEDPDDVSDLKPPF